MAKNLGLDLGTNSIGWAVVESENNTFSITKDEDGNKKCGVLIFQEGVKNEKGTEKSRAAERTGYRSVRRLKFRRKIRKYQTLLVLAENGMCPLTEEEVKAWEKSGFKKYPDKKEFLEWLRTDSFGEKDNKEHKVIRRQQKDNPYFFRDKFSRKKYNWENNQQLKYEIGRAFYHIAQRRGFKSNRLEQSDENIIAEYKDKIQEQLNDPSNRFELKNQIEEIFATYELKEIKKIDCADATEEKLWSIRNYLIKILDNKVSKKDYSSFEDAKAEMDRYINKPENLGKVKGGIKELSQKIEDAGCQTLGQYFWQLYQKNRSSEEHKIRTKYTDREEHYVNEFEIIFKTQGFGPYIDDTKNDPGIKYSGIVKELYKAIFYQRPLKSQKGLVGKCTFEKNKARCPQSRPEFEEFRMWQIINNIKIKTPDDEKLRPLTKDEKEKIIPKFYRQGTSFKFKDIAGVLVPKSEEEAVYHKSREAKTAKYVINYKLNTTISGCPVSANLKNILGDDWKDKTYTYQTTNAKGEIVKRTADYKDIWHVLFTYDSKDKLKEFAKEKLELNEIAAKKFSNISLAQGYGNLSLKAINKILPWLGKGLIYSHAVFMANIKNVVDEDIWEQHQEDIEKAIGEIIDNHGEEVKKINVVNALIGECRDKENNSTYSKEAEPGYKDDIERKLKAIFGEKTWNEKGNKNELKEETFNLFIEHLKKNMGKGEFAKTKRIDDRVKEFLLGNNKDGVVYCRDEQRINNKLYHPSDLEAFKPELAKDKDGKPSIVNGKELHILPSPISGSIKNPVLMRAMHQLRKLINELLKEEAINERTAINIEMAREVNDANKRKAYKQWQVQNEEKRKNAISEIKNLYRAECGKEVQPTEDDILRYLLWEEQERKEIYEDECHSISICDIIGENPKYDIEHTIPRSRSWDNSMMNKTLCSKKFNREIKGNKIPFELGEEKQDEILQRIVHWKERYDDLYKQIEDLKRKTKNPTLLKDKKDELIVKRHVLTFEHDYWKGKYERFTMEEVPEGFKNSQIVDIGLITSYAREYLSCLFKNKNDNSNVRTVTGTVVDQFRKAWGLQEEYEKKERTNHIHHCIDAVTIACMTKDKYDAFVEEWRKAEENKKYDVKEKLQIPKPWENFTEDVKDMEKEVLIVHHRKDNVPKQSKKKLRKRGKIQYKDQAKTQPIYQQGDTVRGSLHKDTFYGKIKNNTNGELQYVIRKKLSDLKTDADLDKIVDKKIKEVVKKGREKEKELKKEIEDIKKQESKADEEKTNKLTAQIKAIQHKINNELYVIPPKEGKTQYTPIRKVRIKAHVNSPLPEFKKHRDESKHPHKRQYYVQNDENYCMVIYEDEERKKRSYEIIKLIDVAQMLANGERKRFYPDHVVINKGRKSEMTLPILQRNGKDVVIKTGTVVLLYENTESHRDILKDMSEENLEPRLYKIIGIDDRIKMRKHNEARPDKQLKEDLQKKLGGDYKDTLVTGHSYYSLKESPIKMNIRPSKINALIEGVDFKITPTGKIKKM